MNDSQENQEKSSKVRPITELVVSLLFYSLKGLNQWTGFYVIGTSIMKELNKCQLAI